MILGATRTGSFTRPAGAGPNFQPGMPKTGFYSHFHPLTQVTQSMGAENLYRPPYNGYMGPQALPAVPMPVPVPAVAPSAPVPGGMAGAAGFGSNGGTRMHAHVNPYMTMRQGVIPGVMPSGANIRDGVRNAGARVHRSLPFQTAPLPPMPALPPPAAVMPATPVPGATNGFGRAPHRRGWISRMISPPTVAEMQCETVGPRSDGLMVKICNGRVVEYSDAQGNVRPVASRGDFAGW